MLAMSRHPALSPSSQLLSAESASGPVNSYVQDQRRRRPLQSYGRAPRSGVAMTFQFHHRDDVSGRSRVRPSGRASARQGGSRFQPRTGRHRTGDGSRFTPLTGRLPQAGRDGAGSELDAADTGQERSNGARQVWVPLLCCAVLCCSVKVPAGLRR